MSLAFLVGCSSGGDTAGSLNVPDRLVFVTQPEGGTVGVPLAVEVAIVDRSGRVVRGATGMVSIELVAVDSKAKMLDVLSVSTVPAKGGRAWFNSLTVDHPVPRCLLRASALDYTWVRTKEFRIEPPPRNVILMVADGWGYKHIEATEKYVGKPPVYASWSKYPMSTWDLDTQVANGKVGYDPTKAWSNMAYLVGAATESAAAATAMYTGQKTDALNISTSAGDRSRLLTLGEFLAVRGISTGAVSSVPINHATPAAWIAHNDDRWNYYAIADEAFFGDPNTTGNPSKHTLYSGGRGVTLPGPSLLIGGGHPQWSKGSYINQSQLAELRRRSAQPGGWSLVERINGNKKAADRLMAAARDPKTERLCGLFGGVFGNIELRGAKGLGHDPENPTLVEMTKAALTFMERKQDGFALVVEGGAVDWGSHSNAMDAVIGEMMGFDAAVRVVSDWVDDSTNKSSWGNTLVIVTGDHECGMPTSGFLVPPDAPFGEISDRTLSLEKPFKLSGNPSGLRASWEDVNNNGEIDLGSEKVYWVWHTSGHSNSLIPLYAKGVGSDALAARAVGADPVRGKYVDNTDVFHVIKGIYR